MSGLKTSGFPRFASVLGEREIRRWLGASILMGILLVSSAAAKDVRISVPKRTKPTPVQKLNQEGVEGCRKARL